MVKFQRRGPRYVEGRRPPQRQRRGDAHLRVSYARSHTAQRVNLGSVRLPASDDETAAFLHHAQAVLVEVGVGGGELTRSSQEPSRPEPVR
jgi:hypothetical protein